MSGTPENIAKGRERKIEWCMDGGTFVPLCLISSAELTVDSPVSGTTTSCTTGNLTDAEFTGYDTITMNLSGVAGKQPDTPTFMSYQNFRNEFMRGKKRGQIRYTDPFGVIVTTVNITNFSQPTEQEEHITFTATLQFTGNDYTLTDTVL